MLTLLVDQNGYHVPAKWCHDRCWPNHPPAQLAMLRKMGVNLSDPPEGMDLLEWARQCVEDGTVTVQSPAQKRYTKKVLPGTASKLANLWGAAKDVAGKLSCDAKREGIRAALAGITCSPKQSAARKAVCDACDQAEEYKGRMRCLSLINEDGKTVSSGCGCYLHKKQKVAAASCGLGKWDKIDAQFEPEADREQVVSE